MNLQHLRYFVTMMELGSVSRAAAQLGITQPTLSVALKRLEEEFGAALFVSAGRGLKPLPAALRLEDYARSALQTLAEARKDLAGKQTSELRVGILSSLASAWAPRVGKAWSGRVYLREGAADDLLEWLSRQSLDVVLTALSDRLSHPQLPLFREPFRLFVGAAHPLAGRASVPLADLHRQDLVLRQGCEQAGTARRLLEAAGVRFRIAARAVQESTAAAFVAAGLGCTLAPRSWGYPDLRSIPVESLKLERVVGLVWSTPKGAAAAGALAEALRRLLPGFD